MSRILEHLGRLGGVLIRPGATFERLILERQGNVLELVPWGVLATVVASPIEAGRSLLLFRLSFAEGAMSCLMMLSSRLSPALFGLLGAALLLHGLELVRRPAAQRHGLDAAIDTVGFTLVPYLGLIALGALLSMLGLELWWLPHRALKGTPSVQATRALAAFAWPVALFVRAAVIFLGRAPEEQGAGNGERQSERAM